MIARKGAAVAAALFGLLFVAAPVQSLHNGLMETDPGKKEEFTNHILPLMMVWGGLFLVGLFLLFTAARILRKGSN